MGEVRASEVVSLIYFVLVALLTWARPAPPRARAVVMAVALCVSAGLWLTTRAHSPVPEAVRDWLPLVLLVLGYWTPGLLVTAAHEPFERWLVATDARFLATTPGSALLNLPPALNAILEASYTTVYLLVPVSLGLIVAGGGHSEVDRFWTTVLTAEFLCYGLLPMLPTRPPRALEGRATPCRGATIRLNRWVLDRFSNQWNTFPSGHVAGSLACALGVAAVLPLAGAFLIALAVLIAVASVAGRYHYTADALAGWAVAIACFAAVRFWAA